jgi:hypothetical protein
MLRKARKAAYLTEIGGGGSVKADQLDQILKTVTR